MNDHAIAAHVGAAAGSRLVQLRGRAAERASADHRSHELIVELLGRLAPGDAVRSEEGNRASSEADRVWIVDPLDGTREYAEAGRHDWAVHVALWCEGGVGVGAVALPATGDLFTTARLPDLVTIDRQRPVITVSRTRPPAEAVGVARALGADLLPLGSAGAKTVAVIRGEADAYIHSGGQFEWDSAAPTAVAAAAGLHVSRLDGSQLSYNQPDPWLPDLLVCRIEIADAVLEAVARQVDQEVAPSSI